MQISVQYRNGKSEQTDDSIPSEDEFDYEDEDEDAEYYKIKKKVKIKDPDLVEEI